ncbi:hypothetical protein [Stagnihabitans tardus]|uniref:Uncharacterized protein n=1 Tax=Stagnihabitans tardus TaxID=2699202 RepID=A0AAE4YEM1_9RHOB|nr:hypothetical protein [Stagnihabitans tardus]NBZ88495.1 hypothetical protein [Stagnihabitans tardus]
MNLDEMQRQLASIYPNADIPVQFMVNRISANTGVVVTNHLAGTVHDDPFVEIVAWSIAIFSKARKSFWQEILLRYPNQCYRCLEPVCICKPSGGAPREVPIWRAREERISRGNAIINSILSGAHTGKSGRIPYISEPPTLDQVSEMLARIYSRNDTRHQYNRDSIFTDVLRCLGRLSHEMCKKDNDASREALTDHVLSLLAWILAVWRLSSEGRPTFSPTEAFQRRYLRGCPICARVPCTCGDNRFNRLSSFDIVASDMSTNDPRVEFLAQLAKVNTLLQQEALDALPVEMAGSNKNTILERLESKRKALESIDKASDSIGSIGKKLAALTSWVIDNLPG